nr:hypothetical protein [Mycobacterium palustre]
MDLHVEDDEGQCRGEGDRECGQRHWQVGGRSLQRRDQPAQDHDGIGDQQKRPCDPDWDQLAALSDQFAQVVGC